MEAQRKKMHFVLFEELEYVDREEKLRIIEKVKVMPSPAKIDFGKFSFNEIELPDDNGWPRDRFHLLEEIHGDALPRLLTLQAKYPPGSFITIGESSNPANRDNNYNDKAEFYRRDSFNPPLKIEEQILFRSNNKFNALMVEYFFQFHLSEGYWAKKFSALANPQRKLFAYLRDYEPEPHYVYAKFSSKKANFSFKPIDEDEDDSEDDENENFEPAPSPHSLKRSLPSSSPSKKKLKSTRASKYVDSDDDD